MKQAPGVRAGYIDRACGNISGVWGHGGKPRPHSYHWGRAVAGLWRSVGTVKSSLHSSSVCPSSSLAPSSPCLQSSIFFLPTSNLLSSCWFRPAPNLLCLRWFYMALNLLFSICPFSPDPPLSLKLPTILPIPPPLSSPSGLGFIFPVTSPDHSLPAAADAAPHQPQVPSSPPWPVILPALPHPLGTTLGKHPSTSTIHASQALSTVSAATCHPLSSPSACHHLCGFASGLSVTSSA